MASSIYRTERRKNYRSMEPDGEDAWKLSNIGGIGSADDIKLRADAALSEESFARAGEEAGVEVWRVEKFEIERIEALRAGNLSLYSGDAYLVLHTEVHDDGAKSYNLHYWIGDDSTQDEAAAVAYYAVTLDDLLGQKPVQHRETQDEESQLFMSHFKSVVYLKGGVDSGFKRVQPEAYAPRLLRMSGVGKSVKVKQIEMDAALINSTDVFLLDLGLKVYQFNAPNASAFERRRAMEIVQIDLKCERDELELVVFDGEQELLEADEFWEALGGPAPPSLPLSEDSSSVAPPSDDVDFAQPKTLFKISDRDGELTLRKVVHADTLDASQVNDDDVWAIAVDGKAFFYVGAAASHAEKLAVRMNAASLLEAMKLPRFALLTLVSPEQKGVWNSIFE